MTAHVDRDENTTGTDAAKATLTSETFPHSNETTVTFFDEDGYEYSLVLTNARDEADARTRAHCAARAKILDGEWRPHGTLLIGGLDVRDMTRARARPGGAGTPRRPPGAPRRPPTYKARSPSSSVPRWSCRPAASAR